MSRVTEQAVRAVLTPAPVGRWHPIGHARLLDEINAAVAVLGLSVTDKRFDLMDNGDQFFGTYGIGGFDRLDIPGNVSFMIGFRGSIDKTLAESIAFGTRVCVCSNGMFCGEKILSRKNTTNIMNDLPIAIRNVLDLFQQFRDIQMNQFKRFTEIAISDADAHDFICRSALLPDGQDILTDGEIAKVIQEWHSPSHTEFESPNAWRLHNAYTEVAKRTMDRNPLVGSARTIRLNNLFVKEWANDLPTLDGIFEDRD